MPSIFWKSVKRIVAGLLLLALALVVLAWLAGAWAKSRFAGRNPPPGQMVDVGGFRMHIYCIGEGSPAVVLEAGLDDFSIFWSQVQPKIAKSTRVCSYDRAGLGWSEPSLNARTAETLVEELHLLLVSSQINEPFVLVGHSFGGALMRLYTHRYPNEIVGMVLVDAAPDELFVRIPAWRDAIAGKLGLYRKLAPMSSFGLLALTSGSIPNRGMPEDVLALYRQIVVSTGYFQTALAENEAFESNLAEVRNANISLDDLPLVVISRGYWDAMPGFSEAENQHAWQAWQEMQVELLSLSSISRQVIAAESEHSIHLQQPDLVIDAILDLVQTYRK